MLCKFEGGRDLAGGIREGSMEEGTVELDLP